MICEDHAVGEVELLFERGEDAVAEGFVFDQRGVEAGDAEVGFGEGDLYVADDVEEEGEVAGHGLERCEAVGVLLDELLEGVAYAEVGGDELAGLHPAEDPGMARRSPMDFCRSAWRGGSRGGRARVRRPAWTARSR